LAKSDVGKLKSPIESAVSKRKSLYKFERKGEARQGALRRSSER